MCCVDVSARSIAHIATYTLSVVEIAIWDTHRGSMRTKRVPRMMRFDNEGCADRLLAEILLQNARLTRSISWNTEEPA